MLVYRFLLQLLNFFNNFLYTSEYMNMNRVSQKIFLGVDKLECTILGYAEVIYCYNLTNTQFLSSLKKTK